MVRNGKWWDKGSDLLLVVWLIAVWLIVCLVAYLVDRRLSPHCLCLDDPPFGLVSHRLSSSRTPLNQRPA